MYPGVINVEPKEDFILKLYFENGEKKIFDLKPYLNIGLFAELKDIEIFNSAKVSFDTVMWDNELDIDPEMLYVESLTYVSDK